MTGVTVNMVGFTADYRTLYDGWDNVPAPLATRTTWRRRGRRVLDGAEAVAFCHTVKSTYGLYKEEQTEAKPPTPTERRALLFTATYGYWRGALEDAAEALFQLNRLAKHKECKPRQREAIYTLKNRLLRILWDEGYCVEAYIAHSPVMEKGECYACGGSGFLDDDGEYSELCYKCDGTGRYRVGGRPYWALRFRVNGKPYGWHQPMALAKYVTAKGDAPEAPAEVRAEEKPVTLAKRKVGEALALLKWTCDEYDAAQLPPF